MDEKQNEHSEEQPEGSVPVQSNDKKIKNTVPTVYPDIEYVNRTLP